MRDSNSSWMKQDAIILTKWEITMPPINAEERHDAVSKVNGVKRSIAEKEEAHVEIPLMTNNDMTGESRNEQLDSLLALISSNGILVIDAPSNMTTATKHVILYHLFGSPSLRIRR